MTIRIITVFLFLWVHGLVKAQSSSGDPVSKLCGCFDVVFQYAETFSPDTSYRFHEREKVQAGVEWVFPIVQESGLVSLQHLLVVGDQYIVKHWREDWVWEQPFLWKFQGNGIWVKVIQPATAIKNKWVQTVWEVSEAPRYQGASEWLQADGQLFWLNTADAPLPRREYSQRNDYNILRRTNRIVIHDSGWVHEQDNRKIMRSNSGDRLLAEEKGINNYRKIDTRYCQQAQEWWQKHQAFWQQVRTAWAEHLSKGNKLQVKEKVNGRMLHEALMRLDTELEKASLNTIRNEVDKVLSVYTILE